MVRAVGFSNTEFNPTKPGRLCRGRERWIEPWPTEGEPPTLHRLVVSGATFKDDSAREALRGVIHAGTDMVTVMSTLFPRKKFLAFAEDGHPADIPEDAEGVELYETYRAAGRERLIGVRWLQEVQGVHNLRVLLESETGLERVRGFVVLKNGVDREAFQEQLFLLVGMSTLDSPPAHYQPLAIAELLEHVEAVLLLHRDKHGHALGVYTLEPMDVEPKLKKLAERKKALLIPFAIPPMLARWDRALAEAKVTWVAEHGEDVPFPVPESDSPYRLDRRRDRRRRGRNDDEDKPEETTAEAAPAVDEAPVSATVVEPETAAPAEVDEFDDALLVAED